MLRHLRKLYPPSHERKAREVSCELGEPDNHTISSAHIHSMLQYILSGCKKLEDLGDQLCRCN